MDKRDDLRRIKDISNCEMCKIMAGDHKRKLKDN